MSDPAIIVLEDGRAFRGRSFGAAGEAVAEIVFNTSLTGYQEILTDPSYSGQLVIMTVPHVGNYGICEDDDESGGPKAAGFAVRSCCRRPSSHRAKTDLVSYFRDHGLLGVEDVDTRALTRHLRVQGAMMGIVSTVDLDEARLLAKVRAAPGMVGRDLVSGITCEAPYDWRDPHAEGRAADPRDVGAPPGPHVVVLDCGVKFSILRSLGRLGAATTVVPAATSPADILALRPDGVLLSNGPGDPAAVGYAVETVRGLLGRVPLFGVCLGHQLLSLALGARTYKLKFGHRGGNQPVKNLDDGRVHISAHNHGFAVDLESLPSSEVEPWFVNLNDGTNEGIRCRTIPAASVQFHPEAAPGPNDCRYLLEQWLGSLGAGAHAGA